MKHSLIILILLVLSGWIVSPLSAEEHKYVGVKKCRKCHNKTNMGKQFKKWKNASHSKAFEVLEGPKAREVAEKAGIEVDNPLTSKKCLICHAALKYDAEGKELPANMYEDSFSLIYGTQCEVCHGAGEHYSNRKTMEKIKAEGGMAKSPTAKELGLLRPTEETCKRCHVPELAIGGETFKNPTPKEFNFKERFEKISHMRPKQK